MPSEHLIRLRGAWEFETNLGGEPITRRVDLPTVWPADVRSPFCLGRRFGAPRLDPARDEIFLRLEDVAGLRKAWLNDIPLDLSPATAGRISIAIGTGLNPRNLLVLEVDPSDWDQEPGGRWGTIALAIVST